MTIKLKKCTSKELHTLQTISHETFDETFKEQNTTENMKVYPENGL
jgi:diamine N-acetyltransferase